ncbi:MAG: ATPase, T2SS/T4P/T4SS family [Bacillota bacterium]|nr:ATPase, T2SS/T4P/T4SS family [Bacillota bacterium]
MKVNNIEEFKNISKEIDEILNDTDKYQRLYNVDRKEAEKEIQRYSGYKDKAALGRKEVRAHIINQYTIILKQLYKLDDDGVNRFIDFKTLQNNNVQTVFEMLLDIYDLSELINKYNLFVRVSEKQMWDIAIKEESTIIERFDLTRKLKLLSIFIYADVYGQDVVDTLQHHKISEIGIIDKDYVYIVYKGNKLHLEFLRFEDENVILNIQKKTTRNAVLNYDKSNPTLVTAKDNSSRITVAGFNATAEGDLYYNERIFNLSKITLEEMRDTYHTINNLVYSFLTMNQKGRGSHFVTGSDMGVGKSTFLLAMMEKVPDMWGIGILDTQNELQARKKYPWKNVLTLIENPDRTIAQLFEIMLKMARDVIYVGEITKPAEVAELVNSSLRLNAGVGATLHSKTPFEVVTNLRNLMMRTEMYNNSDVAEADIARGIDLVVHLAKLENGRIIVDSIVEIEYVEQETFIAPVEEGRFKDILYNLARMAQFAVLKYIYKKSYKYNVIIQYDREKDDWIPKNMPSSEYFSKISRYLSAAEIEGFKSYFIESGK